MHLWYFLRLSDPFIPHFWQNDLRCMHLGFHNIISQSYPTFLSMFVIVCAHSYTGNLRAMSYLASWNICNITVAKVLCILCILPFVSWNVVNIFHHSVTLDTLPKHWAVCWDNHAGSFCTKAFDLCNRSHWHKGARAKGGKRTEKLIIFVHHILLDLDPGTSVATKAMYCISKGTKCI